VELEQKTLVGKRLSRAEFLQNLIESGLFSEEEIDTALKTLPETQAADGDTIAEGLVAAEKLTPFQADAVRGRRFDELVIGNYQVLDRLGAGGMGTVYKARHRRMKRVVAIKVLPRSVAQSEAFLPRFQREVEAVARLNHPNIVLAHDADEAEVGHFLVMEFVNGRDLTAEVAQRGPLPVREAVEYTLQAARALEYAHAQGIIHRDIKPANLLRDATGVVKVADLGLARFSDQFERPTKQLSALTQAGAIMGTVDFMSPEQALGLTNIDERTDIYSLGCTLHYLLLGRPPYEGPTMMAVLLKHREAPIPSLAKARSDVPAVLDTVFGRMVAKAPAHRFPTMTEVAQALGAVLATQQGAHAPRSPGEEIALPSSGLFHFETGATEPSAVLQNRDTSLPGVPSETAKTIDVSPAGTSGGIALKILLVEPSRTQSGIIRRYLQGQGVQHIVAVATGQEALAAVKSDRPDALVSALHLSDMTGVQLAQQVRADHKEAAPGFVLISSEAERSEAGSLSKCGKAVLLQKPFSPEQLVQALKVVTARPSDPCHAHAQRGHATPRPSLRVLIVDDSAPARLHIRGVLGGLGFAQFVEAPDGAQAVAAVAREAFDLIVTDYNMPYMDGRGLVGYLKQNPSTARVPIIMVTTEQDPAKLDAVRQLGVTVCDKSFQPEVIRKIVDQLV
jgi:serine/threonine protein kinase/DNA-binding response OmpR family regulator